MSFGAIYGGRERRGGALDERTEPAAVRPRRKRKSLPRDGVGIHKRAVRRARDPEERAIDDGGRGFVNGGSGRHAKARGIRRVDMLRPVREDWLQTEDIEHVQRVDGLGTEHELNFFNFALRRQSRPRELHAHVLPVANRHAGNNDAAAEDIAVAKTRGLRYLFVGADPLRAVDVAIRDPEGELLAHDPVAVIDEIARAARVAAQVQRELPRVARRWARRRDRDLDSESQRVEL